MGEDATGIFAKMKRLAQSKMLRNVSVLMIGTLVAQAINLLALPLLTRLFDAEAFGQFGTFMAICAVLATVVTGRYNLAVMLPRLDAHASSACRLAVCIAVGVSAALALVALGLLATGSSFLGLPPTLLLLAPIGVFFLGLQQVFEVCAGRSKQFVLLAKVSVYAAFCAATFKLVAGWYFVGSDGSIGSEAVSASTWLAVGSVLSPLVVVYWLSRNTGLPLSGMSPWTIKRCKVALKKYRQFPLYRAPKDAINSLSQNLPIFLIGIYFSAPLVGFYVVAERLMKVPSVLVGAALRKVIYQRAAQDFQQGRSLKPLITKTTTVLAITSALPFLAVGIFGPRLFEIVLGAEWASSGEIASWLSLWMFFVFINVPSVVCIPLLNLERRFLKLELVFLCSRLAGFVIGALVLDDAVAAIAVFCGVSALTNAITILLLVRASEETRDDC